MISKKFIEPAVAMMHEHGFVILDTDAYYEGIRVDDKMHGHGILTFSDG